MTDHTMKKNPVSIPHTVWHADDIRRGEREAADALGLTLYELMLRAGEAAFQVCRSAYPDARHWLVLCGHGNNGGDGYVVARLATAVGIEDPEEWEEQYSDLEPDILAYFKLRIITKALNDGWEPKFIPGEYRWAPYFLLYTKEEIEKMNAETRARVVYRSNNNANAVGGVSCAGADDSAYVNTNIGSRLAFKSKVLAEYAGKQFTEIYADFIFKAEEL